MGQPENQVAQVIEDRAVRHRPQRLIAAGARLRSRDVLFLNWQSYHAAAIAAFDLHGGDLPEINAHKVLRSHTQILAALSRLLDYTVSEVYYCPWRCFAARSLSLKGLLVKSLFVNRLRAICLSHSVLVLLTLGRYLLP